MSDEQFRQMCNVYGFAPSRALREMMDAVAGQAVIAEREACAKVCESIASEARVWPDAPGAENGATVKAARLGVSYISDECASAIRARGRQ